MTAVRVLNEDLGFVNPPLLRAMLGKPTLTPPAFRWVETLKYGTKSPKQEATDDHAINYALRYCHFSHLRPMIRVMFSAPRLAK